MKPNQSAPAASTAQGAIEAEIVALVTLHETARKHYLEHIATTAMGYAPTYILAVFVVGKRRTDIAHCPEIIEGIVAAR